MSSTADPKNLLAILIYRERRVQERRRRAVYWRLRNQDGDIFGEGEANAALASDALFAALAAADHMLGADYELTALGGQDTLPEYLDRGAGATITLTIYPSGGVIYEIHDEFDKRLMRSEHSWHNRDVARAFNAAVAWLLGREVGKAQEITSD